MNDYILNLVTNYIKSIRNNANVEFIIYISYAYALTLIAIVCKPTWITISILVAYVYVHTFLILKNGKCEKLNDTVVMMIVTLLYTISCNISYYGMHYIYSKRKTLIWLLFFTPILYFIYIKLVFYSFGCNMFSNYHYGIDTLLMLLQSIRGDTLTSRNHVV